MTMTLSSARRAVIGLQARLEELDRRRIRPLADVALGNGNVADAQGKTPVQRLADIEADAVPLRADLAVALAQVASEGS